MRITELEKVLFFTFPALENVLHDPTYRQKLSELLRNLRRTKSNISPCKSMAPPYMMGLDPSRFYVAKKTTESKMGFADSDNECINYNSDQEVAGCEPDLSTRKKVEK
jgi:hypothetical protein